MNAGSLCWGISYSALLWSLAVGMPEPAAAAPQETVLYSFTGGPDGALPLSELLITKNGALIGTTSQGGDLNGCGGAGCGVVFELTPPPGSKEWKETVLHRFKGGSDGAYPPAEVLAYPPAKVLMDKTGALYGVTSGGGGGMCRSYNFYAYTGSGGYWRRGPGVGCGTIFKLTPPTIGHSVWTESVLFSFGGKDGRFPAGALLMDKTGALYGVTGLGGEGPCGYFAISGSRLQYPTGCGTVFELTPPAAGRNAWTLTTLHRFKGKPDGAFPGGGVIFAADGSLLGTTPGAVPFSQHATYKTSSDAYGNGTVFKLTPPARGDTVWTKTIIYGFKQEHVVAGELCQDRAGALFGTLPGPAFGSVFQLSPPATGHMGWDETTLYFFAAPGAPHDGTHPSAGLIRDAANGDFYGVTDGGGIGYGTVFSLQPPAAGGTRWTEVVLHQFGKGKDGQGPSARLAMDEAGNLYGTTAGGGAHGRGTVFKVSP
jgi:uncharacterized repeat protein (TIGR03803 family)